MVLGAKIGKQGTTWQSDMESGGICAPIRYELVSHLDRNELIRSSWHGFRKGLSWASNVHAFLACIDDKLNVHTVYLERLLLKSV